MAGVPVCSLQTVHVTFAHATTAYAARSEQTLIVIATYFCRTLRLRRGKELVGLSSVNRER